MTDITYIILGVILIVFGVGAKIVWPNIQARLTAEQLNALRTVASIVVYAAEKIFGAKMGEDKLAYALNLAKRLLAKKKLSFDEDEIRAAIEAQVYALNQEQSAGGKDE